MSDKKEGITGWASKDGEFKRQTSSFRDHIEENGKFAPEKGRYHLFVALACPWAHRALIVRKLKGLEDYIDVSTVHPHMLEGGWHFIKPSDTEANAKATVDAHDFDTFPGSTVDKLHGSHYLSELYYKADKNYNARFTVPVLWDTKTSTVVNNESSEVIRDLNSSFNSILPEGEKRSLDLYPQEHRAEIDELNGWVYDLINNGVYKSGFAITQAAYEKNVLPLFEALDRVEKLLNDGREFLVGGQLTEADVRLFTTIIRFDPVYYYHFKCNLGQIRHDYPNINQWMKKLYWNNPAFKDTTDFDQIKEHYTYSHAQINPTRIVPKGPKVYIEKL